MNGGIDDTDPVTTLAALAVLGFGFAAMALDVSGFWIVWAVGFGAVVPAIRLIRRREEASSADATVADPDGESDVDTALATLRERYARGELSEEAFEAKLEALLETETPETARDRLAREQGVDADTET